MIDLPKFISDKESEVITVCVTQRNGEQLFMRKYSRKLCMHDLDEETKLWGKGRTPYNGTGDDMFYYPARHSVFYNADNSTEDVYLCYSRADLTLFLHTQSVRDHFKTGSKVEITCVHCTSTAVLLGILQLCGQTVDMTVNVLNSKFEDVNHISDRVSLPKLNSLTIHYDRLSKWLASGTHQFYEILTDLQHTRLNLNNVPLTPGALMNLCPTSLSGLSISKYSKGEFILIVEALDTKEISLKKLALSEVSVPVNFASQSLQTLKCLFIGKLDVPTALNAIQALHMNLEELVLRHLQIPWVSRTDYLSALFEGLAGLLPEMKILTILKQRELGYPQFVQLCELWSGQKRKTLETFEFSEDCGVYKSFAKRYVLSDFERVLTKQVRILSSVKDDNGDLRVIHELKMAKRAEDKPPPPYNMLT